MRLLSRLSRSGKGKGERGQAYVEFLIVLPIFLIFIAGVIGFGRLMYTKLATQAAAYSATRHAVATLDRDRGLSQAYQSVDWTLNGFMLDASAANTEVSYWGGWSRGQQVQVSVCYGVPPAPIPMGDAISPSEICSYQSMIVEPWQSRW